MLLCVAAVVGLEGVSLHAWLPNHGTAPMVGGGGGWPADNTAQATDCCSHFLLLLHHSGAEQVTSVALLFVRCHSFLRVL